MKSKSYAFHIGDTRDSIIALYVSIEHIVDAKNLLTRLQFAIEHLEKNAQKPEVVFFNGRKIGAPA